MDPFEKSQTIDPEVRAHVYSLVSALGGSSTVDDGRYVLGDDALACLKDLRRWLKVYDTKLDRYDVKRCLAEANVVKGDLLEILGQWNQQHATSTLRRKAALSALELLSQLTWPLPLEQDRTTVNHMRHISYLSLAQVEYKRAVLQQDDLLRNVIDIVSQTLITPRRDREPRDEGIIQMTLYFLRNLAAIAQPTDLPVTGDDSDVSRSATIQAFYNQDITSLLLTFASGIGEDFVDQDVILLDTLFHLLKGVNPEDIFAGQAKINTDRNRDFKKLISKERAMTTGYAKNAPSRHNRFGAMIWLKQGADQLHTISGQAALTNDQRTLQKLDESKKWNKPKPRGRKLDDVVENADFLPIDLDSTARDNLKAFLVDFLDSGFNPLFLHLRRAIERQADRIKDSHIRQYYYLISWFLRAEAVRRDLASQTKGTNDAASTDTTFAYITAVLDQESFVLLNRTMQRYLDEKAWPDVHACMLAFTQILSTISAMANSPSQDDRDISENHLGRFFYEEATHVRVLQAVSRYKPGTHSFGYLDAATEMAHVFLRTLERYSKINVDIYIRCKKRARRKAKSQSGGYEQSERQTGTADDGEEELNEADAREELRERKLDVGRLSAKFVNGGCIDTFVHFTRNFLDLDKDQLKRAHRFFHRVAFKSGNPILLYRIDILALLNRMIKGPDGLETWLDKTTPQYREWEELVRHIFRKCIKLLAQRPALIAEMLFTKMPKTLYYLEHGQDLVVSKRLPRPPAELEVKPGMDFEAQLGVAVGILLDQGKADALRWTKSCLMEASAERQSWQDQHTATQTRESVGDPEDVNFATENGAEGVAAPESVAQGNSNAMDGSADGASENAEQGPQAPIIVMRPDTSERTIACFKDKYLRLLLKTLSLERLGDSEDPDAHWIVPPSLDASTLSNNVALISKFEYEPPTYDDNKSAESFTRNVVKRSERQARRHSDDEGDSEIDESLFVPGGPATRPKDYDDSGKPVRKRRLRRASITEAEREERAAERRRRERERERKIKSSFHINASDDESDEERDAAFFQMEAARRKATAAQLEVIAANAHTDTSNTSQKRKSDHEGSGGGKRRRIAGVETDDDDATDEDDEHAGNDDMSDIESLPSRHNDLPSSQDMTMAIVDGDSDGSDDDRPLLVEVSNNRSRITVADEDDNEDAPITKRSRRSTLPVFLMDDDDDD